MVQLKENIGQLRKLVEENRVGEALQKLSRWGKYSEYQVTISLLLSDYNDLKQDAMVRVITQEEERVRLIQIKKSILQLLAHIRDTAQGALSDEQEGQLVQITLAKNEAEFKRLLEHKLALRYTNLEHLSSGDNAIIYRADQVDPVTGVGRKVAIKVIKPLSVIDDENLEHIRADLAKAKQLSGLDGIISVLDEGLDAPPRYIVTEYVDGMRLSDRLKEGWPYQVGEVRDMLYTMARALAQGHASGLVHNNLWPSNVLVDRQRGPRLSPFQVVRASYVKRTFERLRLFAMYWSPEQINRDEATEQSDQYAFGLLAFELFAGRPFFRGETVLDILRKRLAFDENPGLLLEELKTTQCPPHFAQAIARMLRPVPADRHWDMEEVLRAIEGIAPLGELTPQHPDYELIRKLRASYNRCRRAPGFYEDFYRRFLDAAPHAREVFNRAWERRMDTHGYTEERIWKYQHRMLDLAVERMLRFPSVSTAMNQRLQQLWEQHQRAGVQAADYAIFLGQLKEAMWACDQGSWQSIEELSRAWDVVLKETLPILSGA